MTHVLTRAGRAVGVLGIAGLLGLGAHRIGVAVEARMDACACHPAARLDAMLAMGFAERAQGAGLSIGGRMVAIYASPGGSWTLVETGADGMACIRDEGGGWTARPAGEPS